MPENLSGLVILLLAVAPGAVYQTRKAKELRRRRFSTSTFRSDPVQVPVMMVLSGTLITGLAVALLVLFALMLKWLDSLFDWISLTSPILPDPGHLMKDGMDYASDQWKVVIGSAAAALLIALLLARFLGAQQGRADAFAREDQRRVELLSAPRSLAVVRLKSGTVYTGTLLHPPEEGSSLDEELILFAPIHVQTPAVTRMLQQGESMTLAGSEIASLTLTDGDRHRLYLYSDAVAPTWLRDTRQEAPRTGRGRRRA
jgi:hypothetical protein